MLFPFALLFRYGFVLVLSCALFACASAPSSNYNRPMNPAVMTNVKVGISEAEVRQVLGSPTIQDVFHPHLLVYLFIDPKGQPWQALIVLDDGRKVRDVTIKENAQAR